MNERIQKLYEQAHGRKPTMVVDHETGQAVHATFRGEPMYTKDFDPERFAELIIKECVQFIDEENVRLCKYKNSLPEWDGNRRGDCDLAIEKCIDLAERLKEHFGVENEV